MTDQARMDVKADRLTLKWGTLKGWNLQSKKAQEIFRRYAELGMSMGAMQQADTPSNRLCVAWMQIHDAPFPATKEQG